MKIHDAIVEGVDVDTRTGCAHYRSPLDIIAIKFKCCGKFYPCYECHAALANHTAERWSNAEFDTPAILCGACGHQLTIHAYFAGRNQCPKCTAKFNPGCQKHYYLYFEN